MRRLVHLAGHTAATLACVAGVPALVISLVWWLFGVPLSAFRPVINDEVSYWHQALTFSTVGLRGGYYTLGELTNASGFTPFGPHGPGFAIAYGTFGAMFGWYRHSVVVLNLAAIGAAATLWVSLSRLNTARLFLSALLLATFWHLDFWAPTGMQEGLHHAGAIAMAAFFAYALGPARRLGIAAGWLVLVALAFIRPSWVVLIPLWALVTMHPRRIGTWVAIAAGSFLLALVIIAIYSRSVAPFPTGFFFLKAFDLSAGGAAIWQNVLFNVQRTFSIVDYERIELLHRVQYWTWLLVASAAIGYSTLAWRRGRTQTGPAPQILIGAAAMAAALFLMYLLYTLTNWAEHRVLSAFLLFAALLSIAAPGRRSLTLAVALVASNLATTPLFLQAFETARRDNFVWDRRGVFQLSDAIAGKLAYRPNAPRWCNTLLTAQYPPYLIAIPAGIGLSVVREADTLPLPPHSQYLLLDGPAVAELSRPLRLEPLASLPYGTLYRNLESGCQ